MVLKCDFLKPELNKIITPMSPPGLCSRLMHCFSFIILKFCHLIECIINLKWLLYIGLEALMRTLQIGPSDDHHHDHGEEGHHDDHAKDDHTGHDHEPGRRRKRTSHRAREGQEMKLPGALVNSTFLFQNVK